MRYGSKGLPARVDDLTEAQVQEIREVIWEHRVHGVGFPRIPALIQVQFNVKVSRAWCHQQAKLELTSRETETRAQFRAYSLEQLDNQQQAVIRLMSDAHRAGSVALTRQGFEVVLSPDSKLILDCLKELRAINESRRKLLGIDADPLFEEALERAQEDADVQELLDMVRSHNERAVREARS